MPIAHGEGRYVASDRVLTKIARNNQITFKYFKENPNGSIARIAAVCNDAGNVMGIMPHPERALVNGQSKEAATILQALSIHR
jgi:phosphoribosylformylglycinamidine synthase